MTRTFVFLLLVPIQNLRLLDLCSISFHCTKHKLGRESWHTMSEGRFFLRYSSSSSAHSTKSCTTSPRHTVEQSHLVHAHRLKHWRDSYHQFDIVAKVYCQRTISVFCRYVVMWKQICAWIPQKNLPYLSFSVQGKLRFPINSKNEEPSASIPASPAANVLHI